MKILLLDHNHPLITDQLLAKGFILEEDFTSSYDEVLKKIDHYGGIIIRSRIPLDKKFLENARNLKFIARVGAGMENIDLKAAKDLGIELINSPEGNRDSVAEHVVGMLLILMNRLFIASNEVKNGIWKREENRGDELLGKTFGIIGYGNMRSIPTTCSATESLLPSGELINSMPKSFAAFRSMFSIPAPTLAINFRFLAFSKKFLSRGILLLMIIPP
jgi:phosphoglycerate dehydrogenase-like enzyme